MPEENEPTEKGKANDDHPLRILVQVAPAEPRVQGVEHDQYLNTWFIRPNQGPSGAMHKRCRTTFDPAIITEKRTWLTNRLPLMLELLRSVA